jgi:hypothetical protein
VACGNGVGPGAICECALRAVAKLLFFFSGGGAQADIPALPMSERRGEGARTLAVQIRFLAGIEGPIKHPVNPKSQIARHAREREQRAKSKEQREGAWTWAWSLKEQGQTGQGPGAKRFTKRKMQRHAIGYRL